ncbi:hypothetical protein F5878DRAFT_549603, partial [Lentinula raphanica]
MLDWDQVQTTVDLIAIRILQLQRRDAKLRLSYAKVRASRQRAIDDQLKRHGGRYDFHEYEEGMYVWLRESQLETQKGNKTDWTYSGPYIIHEKTDNGSFVLRELDGTIMRGHANAQRLRLFFFR